jgi:hypothetical protein
VLLRLGGDEEQGREIGRVGGLRCLPEGAHDGLAVRPCSDQKLVQHAASKTDAAISCALAANGGNEVGVACAVCGHCEAEEVSIAEGQVVEADARLCVCVGAWCLCGSERSQAADEEGGEFHLELNLNNLAVWWRD